LDSAPEPYHNGRPHRPAFLSALCYMLSVGTRIGRPCRVARNEKSHRPEHHNGT
jgi:hypothetical protein